MNNIFSFLKKNSIFFLGIICILPFLILSFFVHPVGTHGWDWASRHPGLELANLTFWEEQVYWYTSIVGRYSSNAMLSLTHYWFSLFNFKCVPILTIVCLFGSLHFLLKKMFQDVSSRQVLMLTTGIAIIYLDQLSGPYEAFYNLSCILTYQTGAMFFFIMVGLAIQHFRGNKSNVNLILISLLLFLTIGTNEISLIAACGFWFLLLTGKCFYNKKWDKLLVLFFLLSIGFAIFEIFAPGNFIRMDLSPNANNIKLTLFLTLSVSVFNWARWLSSTPLLIFLVLYIPFGIQFYKNNKKDSIFKYPLVALVGVLSFQLVSLLLLFWSVGDEALPERVMDLIFITTLPVLLYFIQCMIEYSLNHQLLKQDFQIPKFVEITLMLFVCLNLFFSDLKIDKSEAARTTSNYLSIIQSNSNVGTAWLEIFNGNAIYYNQNQNEIYKTVQASSIDTLLIPYPTSFPKIIYDETFDRKTKDGELHMGHFFGKKNLKLVKYKGDK